MAAREVAITPSASNAGDAAWIEAVGAVEPVAARHISDLRRLFSLGDDPRDLAGPRAMAAIDELKAVASEYPGARLVAANVELIDAATHCVSLSCRVLCEGADLIIGPHYSHETLVFALRRACEAIVHDR